MTGRDHSKPMPVPAPPFACYLPVDQEEWTHLAPREARWWQHWIRDLRPSVNLAIPLRWDLERLVAGREHARILNVGSGAENLLGTRADVDVVCCDALATEYASAWRAAGLVPSTVVEFGDMTALPYGDESFDVVFCANALDHSHDPRAAIREMKRVCRSGGWVYLRHMAQVAAGASYGGLHQWNIDRYEGHRDIVMWRDRPVPANGFAFSDELPGFINMRRRDVDTEGYRIIAQWRKP